MVRVGSLYSGIAGLELGLLAAFAEAGVFCEIAWQCEIDPFCRRVLAQHFPGVRRFSDVATVSHPPAVDVLCGGFMCTDVSSAGRGKGLGKDTRSGFTLHHLLRIVDEIVPPYLVIENVASGAKRWLPSVVQELRSRGYRPRAVPLGAVDVGAPHLRRRVFVVADRDDQRQQVERGGGEALAHSIGAGLEIECEQQARRQQPAAQRGGEVGGAAMGYTAESRRAGTDGSGGSSGEWRQAIGVERSSDAGGDGRPLVADLGLGAHGLPFDVAGHQWPAGRGLPQEAWEPPRALPQEVRHFDRPAKLRALGNAVVPQCALVVGRVLIDVMRERR